MKTKKKWPERALIGYVTAYGSTIPPNVTNTMISDAIKQQYSVFVYAFGYINSNNNVSLPSSITKSNLQKQIESIHQNNGLALISFGGQNNTFNPSASPEDAANKTVTFCEEYGFDGIDLDIESVPSHISSSYLNSYINAIRNKNNQLFITAAPQIASTASGDAALAPTNIFTKDFIGAVKFDALLIQEYNQRLGAVFQGLQDTQIGFISASYIPLTKLVPEATKIVIGEPANSEAGNGLSNPNEIVEDITDGGIVLQSSQYGGIMTWAINYDAQQNWSFAKGVQTVIQPSKQVLVP
ncbi:glycosyl hydrolase family 18 protein [Tenacibaculum aiptasiae]|uniref:glycosyl hydrolase family 18 protein n=1 Tax=Tenacibaculum aiptasiae TaxID=426481 RepID=UPI00232E48A4|nr:glycosyl hydrolase family 18 protein [Tenacibaculum aiptasiae]